MTEQPAKQTTAEKTNEPRGVQGNRKREPRKKEVWTPVTKLGRLVKHNKITEIDEIFKFCIPIKEFEIVDYLWEKMKEKPEMKEKLREEVMQVKPVQKQTKAGQRTRFKAYMAIGDSNGHVGLGWKAGKDVQCAIKGALMHAKLNLVPVRRGYWGNKIGDAHTITTKVNGKSGSVRIRCIPAPRGTGLVAAPASKKIFQFAGIGDVFTASSGSTRTKGNFVKAVFYAMENTWKYLTPDLWGQHEEAIHPFEKESDFLSRPEEKQEKKVKRF